MIWGTVKVQRNRKVKRAPKRKVVKLKAPPCKQNILPPIKTYGPCQDHPVCPQGEDHQTIYLDFNVTLNINVIWGLHISKYPGMILTY